MTDNEQRVLSFFRCLSPSDQDAMLRAAGKKALYRCLPTGSVWDFLPNVKGVDPYDEIHGISEIIRDGLNALGDPEECALASDAFDEIEFIPCFVEAADETAVRQGSFFNCDEDFARKFICEWRRRIASYCAAVASRMATTVATAESQQINVPEAASNWISLALSLDGERIAEELDWFSPGTHDVDLSGTLKGLRNSSDAVTQSQETPLSAVLTLRMALYEKLRFLQAREELPPAEEVLEEIQQVLDYLRTQISTRHS